MPADPQYESTLTFACGCVNHWWTSTPNPEEAHTYSQYNCRVDACEPCNGKQSCPHRQIEFALADGMKSLEELAIENGTTARRRGRK